eukprot:CAMPEP_0183368964 /NCGR_PEP_ID=MMETSP0164_2-20130417/97794_1 /TAXON_ID=221442 /ORGANISM="Coccolithus pelagicus ssp braarudi, Strain PLY182g" /LENGTH=83 /DNA_ID=CAMNT_0025545143 /DNA_START=93 /DNA_END=344 /DNA_ORIENTATION=-
MPAQPTNSCRRTANNEQQHIQRASRQHAMHSLQGMVLSIQMPHTSLRARATFGFAFCGGMYPAPAGFCAKLQGKSEWCGQACA